MSVVAGNGGGTKDESPPTRSPHPPPPRQVRELAAVYDALYAVNVEPVPAAAIPGTLKALRRIEALARWYDARLVARLAGTRRLPS